MQYTTLYHTPAEIRQLDKQSNGLCLECNRRTPKMFCGVCHLNLTQHGLEPIRVSFTDVGQSTINYQQRLSRRVLGYNAPPAYRGNKSDRIKPIIPKQEVEPTVKYLQHKLSSIPNKYLLSLYNKIKHIPNANNQILYIILLYNISYHIEQSPIFRNELHYQVSLSKAIENQIRRIYTKNFTHPKHRLSRDISTTRYLCTVGIEVFERIL